MFSCLEINTSTAIGAFTYPHGALTTFEIIYGPRGWYLKHPFGSSSRLFTNPVRTRTTTPTTTTTTQLPIIRWDYTWRYTRPARTRVLTTRRRSTTIVTPTTTIATTTSTTITTSTTGERSTEHL